MVISQQKQNQQLFYKLQDPVVVKPLHMHSPANKGVGYKVSPNKFQEVEIFLILDLKSYSSHMSFK